MEFNRIKEIASQAQEIEREKEKVRTPITAFLNTVNDFFGIGEDKKHISISNEGKIRVEADSPHRKLSLYSLSSLKRLAQQTRTLNKYAREYIRNSTEMKMTKSFL